MDLLGLNVTNKPSCGRGAFERERAEQKTRECGCDTGKNDQKFTTFSIATKTSYKNKETGEYVPRTEWHRCIVFGKFGEFAATLKKGAHIQLEGEIRHTEYTPKKAKKPVRTDSVRVTSILKLDRAEKAAPEDLDNEPEPSDDIPF